MNAQPRPIVDTARLSAYDWAGVAKDLDARGYAMLEALLSPPECTALATLYADDERFRSRVVMARHGFGRGEYRYFSYPLPELVGGLRTAVYPLLAPIANRWNTSMGMNVRYPATHAEFIESAATLRASNALPRCCCATARTITTACTRICTASTSFRCRWRSCCPSRDATSTAASSC